MPIPSVYLVPDKQFYFWLSYMKLVIGYLYTECVKKTGASFNFMFERKFDSWTKNKLTEGG